LIKILRYFVGIKGNLKVFLHFVAGGAGIKIQFNAGAGAILGYFGGNYSAAVVSRNILDIFKTQVDGIRRSIIVGG
jgi:hypothetical protein